MLDAYIEPMPKTSKPSGAALTPTDLHVLFALSREELYGYALLQRIEEESEGAVAPDIGSLYRTLSRLSHSGLIKTVVPPNPEKAPGKPRRYYRATSNGERLLVREMKRLERLIERGKVVSAESSS